MRNFLMTLVTAFLTFGLGISSVARAQFDEPEASGGEVSEPAVEELYDSFDREQSQRKSREVRRQRRQDRKDLGTLTDLANLAPFEDVAVIQRRFLPKTGRFEISPSGMITLNNPFFSNMGLGLRGTYYFLEKHGLELQYFLLSNSSRSVTKNLKEKRNIDTKSLTVPKSYMGLAYKWNPIYGKMTLLNKHIVPFDLYFTIGGGLTNTDESDGESTVHVGTGQVFALSKMMAVRWDLTWNFYSAQATDTAGNKVTNNQDDLFLSLGMSFYFPEAKYR